MSRQKALPAPIFSRVKAFIIDMFIILMPILYITTYVILGGKSEFLNSQIAIFICQALFGVIASAFYSISAQTPGYKAQQMYLIDIKSGKKVSFFRAFLRFVCFALAGASVVGLMLAFFRRDKMNLHDILTQTLPVCKKN
ncbi:RDD family protein [Campylobacter sp. 19-13652]|uniref:RDD family protein n=1 Tax=Campylobacter sp. 19-13652 TaxID=2840180 RepID=UPI001C78BBCB|nr:RDD family protein [Campylobacter sp. 19-13652]BCX80190.1 RDD family protein [Campylobacter sp. 19-13652]